MKQSELGEREKNEVNLGINEFNINLLVTDLTRNIYSPKINERPITTKHISDTYGLLYSIINKLKETAAHEVEHWFQHWYKNTKTPRADAKVNRNNLINIRKAIREMLPHRGIGSILDGFLYLMSEVEIEARITEARKRMILSHGRLDLLESAVSLLTTIDFSWEQPDLVQSLIKIKNNLPGRYFVLLYVMLIYIPSQPRLKMFNKLLEISYEKHPEIFEQVINRPIVEKILPQNYQNIKDFCDTLIYGEGIDFYYYDKFVNFIESIDKNNIFTKKIFSTTQLNSTILEKSLEAYSDWKFEQDEF